MSANPINGSNIASLRGVCHAVNPSDVIPILDSGAARATMIPLALRAVSRSPRSPRQSMVTCPRSPLAMSWPIRPAVRHRRQVRHLVVTHGRGDWQYAGRRSLPGIVGVVGPRAGNLGAGPQERGCRGESIVGHRNGHGNRVVGHVYW